MANPKSRCPHVISARGTAVEDIKQVQRRHNLSCESCGFGGPNLWLCLQSDCLYVGCGESKTDHSSFHAQDTRHQLTLNLTTQRIWCYGCECEVHVESNHPPFVLRPTHVSSGAATIESDRDRHVKSQLYDDSDSDLDDRSERPRGLAGLCNIGNTCYMNGAIQALSNCPPLTRFFIDCPGYILAEKKLARSYMKLMHEMWHKRRPNYVVPSGVANAVRQVHPMFRGYLQHDSQEFLRCVMDHLHEELKQPQWAGSDAQASGESDSSDEEVSSLAAALLPSSEPTHFSDTDYETCDSGLSSEHSSVALGGPGNGDGVIGMAVTENCNEQDLESINPPLPDDQEPENRDEEKVSVKSRKDTANLASQQLHVHDAPPVVSVQSCPELSISSLEMDAAELEAAVAKRGKTLKKISTSSLKDLSETSDSRSIKVKSSPMTVATRPENKRAQVVYSSIISDTFDGEILSSVQCMTCHRISCTNETFQDLSLPIPNKDHLAIIRSSPSLAAGCPVPLSLQKAACADLQTKPIGWFAWMYGLFRQLPSWLWGPVIRLQDCLAAFFSADDLKGENMYSCEKCKKLRNGVKYSKVLKLPEVLCIHLKRFRHEYMYSSKIGSFVAFPMEGLDMRNYLHKDCKDQVTVYNLVAVICHHGTAGGGHYTTYALNHRNQTWYEFDDQTVTEVDIQQVENCEAYVLFYRKMDEDMIPLRQKANQITEMDDAGFVRFYISRQWVNKFNTFAEPGPINNYDFLCRHGDVQPKKWPNVSELAMEVPQVLWEFLHERFGGGPAANHLSQCQPCLQEFERLRRRQQYEMETFLQLHEEFQSNGTCAAIYALNMAWFREWENFVRAKTDNPPGPIDNSKISVVKSGIPVLLMNSDHGQMSEDIWNFFHGVYGGGPELLLKQSGSHKVDEAGDPKFAEASPRQLAT